MSTRSIQYRPNTSVAAPNEPIVPNRNSSSSVDRSRRGVDKGRRLAEERREKHIKDQRQDGLEPDFPYRVIEFDMQFFKIPTDPPTDFAIGE